MIVALLLAALTTQPAHAAPQAGNQLSKRTQLRYQDVLTTRSGSRWYGKIIERGEVYRIKLEDNSEVAVPKEEVASLTRELHPGYPHKGQWVARLSPGAEVAFATGSTNAGLTTGPYVEMSFGRNFGGGFEPEIVIVASPIAPEQGSITPEIGIGARYYLQPYKRAKPFTSTQVILYGQHGDLGLRTGPGFLLDISPGFGLGISQGVTLMTQVGEDDEVRAAIGYHFTIQGQGRF